MEPNSNFIRLHQGRFSYTKANSLQVKAAPLFRVESIVLTLSCFLPSVVIYLVTLSTRPHVKFLSITFSMLCLFFCYCELSSNSFKDHCKTRLRQEALQRISMEKVLSTQVKGRSLLYVNCSSRRKIITHGHGNCS